MKMGCTRGSCIMPNQVGVDAHSKNWNAVTRLLVTGMLFVCDCDMCCEQRKKSILVGSPSVTARQSEIPIYHKTAHSYVQKF